MARVELVPEVLDDIDRILDHLERHAVADVRSRIAEIIQAFQILTRSPMIGRVVRGGHRELVIGRGARGYVALYRYVAEVDTVFILALKGQRELGYKH